MRDWDPWVPCCCGPNLRPQKQLHLCHIFFRALQLPQNEATKQAKGSTNNIQLMEEGKFLDHCILDFKEHFREMITHPPPPFPCGFFRNISHAPPTSHISPKLGYHQNWGGIKIGRFWSSKCFFGESSTTIWLDETPVVMTNYLLRGARSMGLDNKYYLHGAPCSSRMGCEKIFSWVQLPLRSLHV